MKSIVLSLLLVALFAAFALPTQTPVVYTLTPATLRANKNRIMNKDAELVPAYKDLIKRADKALQEGPFSVMEKKNDPPSGDKHDYMSLAPYFWPDPSKPNGIPYMRKDGETNPEVKDYKDKEYMPRLCELVNTLALAYYFSDNDAYAQHAAKLIRVWFIDKETRMNPNLNFAQAIKGTNDGRGAGLIDSRHFIKLIDGLGLLNGSKAWSKADQKSMQQWFSDFLHWMQTSPNGRDEMEAKNNHGTWYDAQRLAMALYIDSISTAKQIVQNALNRLDYQMDEDGKFPKEMERTIALHYNLFDLEAFFLIASMAEKLDMNVWQHTTPSGKSLQKGFNFLHPYLTQQKEWTGQQIKPFEFGEGYPVLMKAAIKYKCKDCKEAVARIEGDKAPRLQVQLIY